VLLDRGTGDVDHRPEEGARHAHGAIGRFDTPPGRRLGPQVARVRTALEQLDVGGAQRRWRGHEAGEVDEHVEREALGHGHGHRLDWKADHRDNVQADVA